MKIYEINMSFGDAITALKSGNMVAREGWNGKGLFVFMQVPSNIPMSVVPGMQSLPKCVKDEFNRRFTENTNHCLDFDVDPIEMNSISYNNQLALVDVNNNITGWNPSTSDALANDWIIYQK